MSLPEAIDTTHAADTAGAARTSDQSALERAVARRRDEDAPEYRGNLHTDHTDTHSSNPW